MGRETARERLVIQLVSATRRRRRARDAAQAGRAERDELAAARARRRPDDRSPAAAGWTACRWRLTELRPLTPASLRRQRLLRPHQFRSSATTRPASTRCHSPSSRISLKGWSSPLSTGSASS
jgi:hypothetical protein